MNNTQQSKYTRDEILNTLKGDSIAYVKFVKTNGELRTMKCTRNFKYIPAAFLPKEDKEKKIIKENIETINAFDVDRQGWRSFRVDSVTEYGIQSHDNK